MAVHPFWPLFDLRLRTPRLELRVPSDDDVAELIEVAKAGVHDPDTMPFLTPWSTRPSPQLGYGMAQWHWKARAETAPESWNLGFVVSADGQVIGTQGVDAKNFAALRQAETGSWLGREFQGKGYGTEMRAGVLALGFAGLGARTMRSSFRGSSIGSRRVSERLGYRSNGEVELLFGDEPDLEHKVIIDAETWRAEQETNPYYVPVEIENLEPCLPLLIGPDDAAE